MGFATHGVGDVIGDSFAKHGSGQSGVDVFGVQVLVLAVEEQRGCFATQQVGECAPHHGETEHGSVLWVENMQPCILNMHEPCHLIPPLFNSVYQGVFFKKKTTTNNITIDIKTQYSKEKIQVQL